MPVHEYKVIPAPNRPIKAKGVKSTAEKFALSLTALMNEMGREGWEYVRAETLPCEETRGWTRRVDTSFQTMLVFRREVAPATMGAPETRRTAPALRSDHAPLPDAPVLRAPAPEGPTRPVLARPDDRPPA